VRDRRKLTRRLALLAAIGMFVVIAQGALVTTTGSGEGCGRSWPLCNGEFVPAYAIESMIEFGHRFVTGIEGFLIMGAAVGAFVYYRWRSEIRVLVPIMVAFLFIQAGLGAAAVMWPQTPEIMAFHFGISLIAFASTLLTAVVLYEMHNGRENVRNEPVPRYFKQAVWGLLAYTYVVVYLGAYIRHKEVSMACSDWPLCNGAVVPSLTGDVGIVFLHRLSAALLGLLVVGLVAWSFRFRKERPDLFWASAIAGVLVVVQSVGGALIVWSQMDVYSTMSHGIFIALFFGTLAYLALHVRPIPAVAHEPAALEAASTSPTGQRAPAT
jgi:cytochrome c oxidase assembly protein subunit 15